MIHVEFDSVSKVFGGGRRPFTAVASATWEARGGEVFGLLGPNGAGKTTIIRMLLDIFRPDQGTISVDGKVSANRLQPFKNRVGYLPEERGLFKKRKLMDVLVYLAALKGVNADDARKKSTGLLERFGLADYADKKIKSLSKGMGQKLQIVSCVLHDPELVVFDEPFSGLDPVNVRLVRDLVIEMRNAGKLVFLSTHMMAEVEAVCDRILMIDHGRQILYGDLDQIRRQHTDYDAVVDADANPEGLACVERVVNASDGKHIYLRQGKTINDLMFEMGQAKRPVRRLEEGARPVEDIFVALVGKGVQESAAPQATEESK